MCAGGWGGTWRTQNFSQFAQEFVGQGNVPPEGHPEPILYTITRTASRQRDWLQGSY